MLPDIQTILVPKGAEHQAICRGLRGVLNPPTVFPIPVGSAALIPCLERLEQAGCLYRGQRLLVMGLCGGLTPKLAVGEAVLYQTCVAGDVDLPERELACDRPLTAAIQATLDNSVTFVKAVTRDRVVSRAQEKQALGQRFHADVVDMEGSAALEFLTRIGVEVATLRVVSDDCQADIPNLANAFDANGSLKPTALAIAMVSEPLAAVRLIRGSTRSLKILQNLTFQLFCS